MISRENALEVIGLSKTYWKRDRYFYALKDLNLIIKKGDFCAFLGKNGAGKSTLVGLIAGSIIRDRGIILIKGFDNQKYIREAKLSIGIVPQEVNFDYFFTVREVLENQAGLYGVKQADRITDRLLENLYLSDVADKVIGYLSGGMKRRLLIAKSMVHNPDFLILDEPTEGVDTELRRKIYSYLKELNSQGTTILITTHHMQDVEDICNKVIILSNGRIVAHDTIENFISNSSEKFMIEVKTKDSRKKWVDFLPMSFVCKPKGNHMIEIIVPKSANVSLKEILKKIVNSSLDVDQVFTKKFSLEDAFLKYS